MSASYGNYLTEEDPNKKKPEGTTPSMAPTTATGGTTTPPLGIDGFVGTGTGSNAYQTNVGFYNDQYNTAVDTAKTNRDLGYEYAEGVKNSIYGNAAAQRAEADKNTEVARQRGIIDSQSSYQKAVGAYGSNAETLAGRGLSGSGYGEYLTADAYATHRGQVQNINADALRANREAAYAEKQAQMAADSEYLKNIYGIKTEYNNAMNKAESDKTTGMYQAALGLNEDQNAAYGKLFDSASKGVSLDAIMQDGTWGDLTPEQQQAIKAEAKRFANEQSKADVDANYNTALGLLADGWTIDEIKAHLGEEAWAALEASGQEAKIENASGVMARIKSETEGKTAQEQLLTYLDLAASGNYTLEQLVDIAKSLGHYDALSNIDENGNETGLWASVVGKFNEIESENVKNETLTNIDNAIANDATLEDIQKMPGYDELDDSDKSNIEQAVTDRDEKKEVTIDSVVANLFVPGNEVYSLDDFDTVMRAEGVPSEMREEVISRWQSENVSRALSGIKDGSFFDNTSAADLVENIKNGVYGNRGDDVAAEYSKVLQASIQEADCDIVDFALASDSFDQIKEYLPTNITNRWESEKGNRLKIDPKFAMTNDSKIGSTPVKKGEKITDEATVAALNQYKTNSNSQLITVGKNTYYRDGDSWSLVVDDYTREKSIYPPDLENAVVSQAKVVNRKYTIDGADMETKQTDKRTVQLLEEHFGTKAGTLVKINGRFYVCLADGEWRFAYKK